jgi:hypothetical protein
MAPCDNMEAEADIQDGAPGTSAVLAVTGEVAGPVPTELMAATVAEYSVPLTCAEVMTY